MPGTCPAANSELPCQPLNLAACPNAENLADHLLAISVTTRTTDTRIASMAAVITREGARWGAC
jgi:hypothetical protein